MRLRKFRRLFICAMWTFVFVLIAAYVFALAPPGIKEIERGFVVLEVRVDNKIIEHNVQVACRRDFIKYLKKLIEQSL